MDVTIDINPNLLEHLGHTCELIFEGFNDAYSGQSRESEFNPWHFNYRFFLRTTDEMCKVIEESDMIEPYNQKHISNPKVRAIDNRYQISRKNLEYRVISNTLSQQFYN